LFGAEGSYTDFCVLGLLILKAMTIYELNKEFKATIGLFYSASLGSLQVVLRQLLAKGHISMREIPKGRRMRKVYTITEAGQESFFQTMHAPIPASRLEETSLARLYFLGLLSDASERGRVLTLITATIGAVLTELEARKAELGRLSIPMEYQTIFRYQAKTLDYGIMAHKAALEWFVAVDRDAGNNRR